MIDERDIPGRLGITRCIKCVVCGKLHTIESDTWLQIIGEVTAGLQKNVIFNNFPVGCVETPTGYSYLYDNKELKAPFDDNMTFSADSVRSTVVCRSIPCVKTLLELNDS